MRLQCLRPFPHTCTVCGKYNDDHFCIVLFSALRQTHCAFVTCKSKWVTVAFYGTFWISTKVMYTQYCLVVTWMMICETAGVTKYKWGVASHSSSYAPASGISGMEFVLIMKNAIAENNPDWQHLTQQTFYFKYDTLARPSYQAWRMLTYKADLHAL